MPFSGLTPENKIPAAKPAAWFAGAGRAVIRPRPAMTGSSADLPSAPVPELAGFGRRQFDSGTFRV
jgi:hypothetical protein